MSDNYIDHTKLSRDQRRALAKAEKKAFNERFTDEFELINENDPFYPPTRIQHLIKSVYMSKTKKVRIFKVPSSDDVVCRLSISKTDYNGGMRHKDGLTWDELQEVKDKLGYSDYCAVEIFPPKERIINLESVRHLWVLKENPDYME